MERGDFHYLEWQDLYEVEKPFQILIDVPEDVPDKRTTNLLFSDKVEESVEDVRNQLDAFDLDTHGFTYRSYPSSVQGKDFADRALIERVFLPQCEKILKETMDGVDQVYFYNWLVCLSGRILAHQVLTSEAPRYRSEQARWRYHRPQRPPC